MMNLSMPGANAGTFVALAVDKVFCISIREREDRRELLRGEIEPFGFDLEFVLVDKDSENPERGCFNSHRRCAELALERGYARVLVLEDDACYEPAANLPGVLKRVNDFLREHNPEIFYLGCILGKAWLSGRWRVLRCSAYGGHAYILSRAGCQKLVSHSYAGDAVDVIYKREYKGYCSWPLLFYQWPDAKLSSDIYDGRVKAGNSTVMDADYWARQRRKLSVRNICKWTARTLLKRPSSRRPAASD